MEIVKFEEFELNNESLIKVTGGRIVKTPGCFESENVWCGSDKGDSDTNLITSRSDCQTIGANGF